MSGPAECDFLRDALDQAGLDRDTAAKHANHLVRRIYEKLEDLNGVAAKLTNDWISYGQKPKDERIPLKKELASCWSTSYLKIEHVIVALLAYRDVEIERSVDENGHRSFHLNVLQTIAHHSSNPLHDLLMTSFCIFAEKDRRAFRLQTDTDRVSVHDLLDSARRYRNWHCYGKEEGASCPMQNGIAIAVPGGHSLRVWYYLVIRILVEALKDCYEKETKSADLRHLFSTFRVSNRGTELGKQLVARMSQASIQAPQLPPTQGTDALASLQSALQECLDALVARRQEKKNEFELSQRLLHQRTILENEILGIHLQSYAASIKEQLYDPGKQRKVAARRPAEWERLRIINKERWAKLLQESMETNLELKQAYMAVSPTKAIPLAEQLCYDAELVAAQASRLGIFQKDDIHHMHYREIIKDLAIEKEQFKYGHYVLRQYNQQFSIQCEHLHHILGIAKSLIQDQSALLADVRSAYQVSKQENSAFSAGGEKLVYQMSQQEKSNLAVQIELRNEEVRWMESSWKNAASEREKAVRERDSLKAELESLKENQSKAIAEAQEQGRQEIREILAQGLQNTPASIGHIQGKVTPIEATSSTLSSGDSGSTSTKEEEFYEARKD